MSAARVDALRALLTVSGVGPDAVRAIVDRCANTNAYGLGACEMVAEKLAAHVEQFVALEQTARDALAWMEAAQPGEVAPWESFVGARDRLRAALGSKL